jgi:hypothetical protein
VEIEWAEEGGVRARFVTCPVCGVRLALVAGFEPPGANVEQLFRKALDVHLQRHAREGDGGAAREVGHG